jgi:hypothetical protein
MLPVHLVNLLAEVFNSYSSAMFLSGSHVHTAQTSWSKMATASLAQHPMITMIWVIPLYQNQLHLIRKCIFALFMVRIRSLGDCIHHWASIETLTISTLPFLSIACATSKVA